MSQKHVMPKSEDLSRSLEINAIWTFDTEFPTIFNKSCTYITFKSAVKHRQLSMTKFDALMVYVTIYDSTRSSAYQREEYFHYKKVLSEIQKWI